MSYLIPVSFY